MRRIDVGDFVSIRKIRHQHDDRSLSVAIDRLASGASQRARLFALRVDVARHNGRGNGIVRIEQLQRDDSSGVDRKSVVVDRGSLQAMLARRRAVRRRAAEAEVGRFRGLWRGDKGTGTDDQRTETLCRKTVNRHEEEKA